MSDFQSSGDGELIKKNSTTDQVFELLRKRILSLELPPDAKLSEADVARQLGVSRQPVRDAFFRLSSLGFLQIQPQKATRVTKIRVQDVLKARFVRASIEIEVMRRAVDTFTENDFKLLEQNLFEQKSALDVGNSEAFNGLDNLFHQAICERAGVGFVQSLILENKAHTDRLRFLALASGSVQTWEEHVTIVKALRAKDTEASIQAMRSHLSQIERVIDQLREENHDWFSDESLS